MRIVQILNSLATGGAERMALTLALAQREQGLQPTLYCITGEGPLADEARANGITVRNFRKEPGVSLDTLASMARTLRADKPDVVHTHNPPAHYYGAVAAFLARVPAVVSTRHSPISSRGAAYHERYFRWLLPITDHVVFVSQHAKMAVERDWSGSCARTSIIANGVPVQIYRDRSATPGSRWPRTVFGTIGRLVPVKGHTVLLAAFRQVLANAPQAQLRIIGSGPLESTLRNQVLNLGLQQHVSIEPATNDVSRIMSKLDVFVISSLSEGLPLVALESMAAGLPLVSTKVGGLPDVITAEIGWLCPPADPVALARAMLSAHGCRDLSKKGQTAATVAEQRYDISRMASSYERLYVDLLRSRGHEFPIQLDCA